MHGYRSSRHEFGMYDRLAETLCNMGIAMVRLDFPGNNDSQEPFINCTLQNMHTDVDTVVKYICEKFNFYPSVIGLLGYSMGGMTSLTYLEKLQDTPAAVALWAPGVNLREAVERSWSLPYGSVPQMLKKADEDGTIIFSDQWADTTVSRELLFDMLCASPLQNLRMYEGNVLVIGGENDTALRPLDFHIAYHTAIHARHKEALFLDGKDHDLGSAWGDPAMEDREAINQVITKTANFFKNSFTI